MTVPAVPQAQAAAAESERFDSDPPAGAPSDAEAEPGAEFEAAEPGPGRVRSGLAHPVGLVLAGLVGGGLAYSFDTSSRLAVTSVAVVQGLLIISWVLGTGLIGRVGALVIAAGAAAGADVAVTHHHGQLGELVAVIGLAMVALFGHQLLRAGRRVNVVESLSAIALLVVMVTGMAATLELRYQVDGPIMTVAVVLCVTAALVAGHLIDWIWVPMRFDPTVRRGLLAVVGSVIAGGAVTMVRLRHSVEFTAERALLLGAALALVTALFAVAAAFVAATQSVPNGRVARLARPVATTLFTFGLAAPVGYLLCLALRG